MSIEVPTGFRAMPRWQHGPAGWLEELPARVARCCTRWRLAVDGDRLWYGSNALVVPVRQGDVPLALRLAPPEDPVAELAEALRFWAGRGTVAVLAADPGAGALLLERLDGDRSLASIPLADAVPVLAQVMTRLAVPAPLWAPCTGELVRHRSADLADEWSRLGRPFPSRVLQAALAVAETLATPRATTAVNGDLHFEQVLAGGHEPWVVVDPVLMRGDAQYDLARVLWSRLDEMPSDAAIRGWFGVLVTRAQLDEERSRAWVIFRSVDYWLWGLRHGLTEDPLRCRRLLAAFECT
jgi:streptomycin 6-kinase